MSATFAEWIAWPDRTVVFLAELTPGLVLTGWTAVGGGAPNTYQVALPRFVQSAHVSPVGMYRRCVGARINDTVLTEQASLAAVDAAAGSWYWDEAAELLYVRTPGGGDPDTYTVAMADVRFYLASEPIVLLRDDADPASALYYLPWLTGEAPAFSAQVADVFFGHIVSATGDLGVVNGHGAWHQIVATDGPYAWKNASARFFVGGSYRGQALTRSDYAPMVAMQVEDVAPTEQHVIFRLKPLSRTLKVEVPVMPFFESEYPNLGDGVRGTKKPIGYGRAMVAPPLTDTSGHGVYTVADADYQTLTAVHAVYAREKTTGARTLLTLTTDYTVDLTACTVTVVSATYAHTTHLIEVDVTGRPETTFGAIVKDLLTRFAGVASADIDSAAFDRADLDAPQTLSVWLLSPRTLGSILSTSEPDLPSLEPSVSGTVQQTLAGLWTCQIWDPGYDLATVTKLRKEDFVAFTPQPKLETIYSATVVYYGRDHARQEYSSKRVTDAATRYKTKSVDTATIYTFLRDASAADTLAQRIQFIASTMTTEIEFEERTGKLLQHTPGDKVLVTYDPAPTVDGAYAERAFELIRIDKRHAPRLVVSGVLGDLRGIGTRIGHWAPSATPDWAAASAAERSAYGFWSDSNGLIDPGDPATLNRSVWW